MAATVRAACGPLARHSSTLWSDRRPAHWPNGQPCEVIPAALDHPSTEAVGLPRSTSDHPPPPVTVEAEQQLHSTERCSRHPTARRQRAGGAPSKVFERRQRDDRRRSRRGKPLATRRPHARAAGRAARLRRRQRRERELGRGGPVHGDGSGHARRRPRASRSTQLEHGRVGDAASARLGDEWAGDRELAERRRARDQVDLAVLAAVAALAREVPWVQLVVVPAEVNARMFSAQPKR